MSGDVVVRLDWDLPLNSGGVAITNYIISVNSSQEAVSVDTAATITLDSTGQHFVQVSAVNDCGLVGSNASVTVNVSGNFIAK